MEAATTPLLNFQKTFWEAEQARFLDHTALHSEVLFRCNGAMSPDRAQSIAGLLCKRHRILNSRVKYDEGGLVFEIKEGTQGVEITALRLEGGSTDADIDRAARTLFRKKFDLTNFAPIRFIVITVGADEYIFGAIVHHAVYDSATLEILAAEIKVLLDPQADASDLEHGDFLTFSEYTQLTRSLRDASHLGYWQKRIAGMSFRDNFGDIYTDKPTMISRTVELLAEDISALNALSAKGYTLNILFLSAVVFSLRKISGNRSIMIEAVSSDRQLQETRGTVGCLLDIFPVVVDIPDDVNFSGLVNLVRREFLTCFSRRPGYYLQKLAEIGYAMGQCPQINWAYRPKIASAGNSEHRDHAKRYRFDSLDGEIISGSKSQISIPFALFAEADEARIVVRLVSVWLSERTIDDFVDNLRLFFAGILKNADQNCFDR